MLRRSCVLAMALAAAPSTARADNVHECLDASMRGQTARDAHYLLEAREMFRACALPACPSVVQRDCTTWLAQVQADLPTVIISAKDPAGADLPAVKVDIDGVAVALGVDGEAVPLNPGLHTFHFEVPGGASTSRSIIVTEGSKDQRVAVVLGAPPPPVESHAAVRPAAPAARRARFPVKTVGFGLGAGGLFGLGLGAAFGIKAIGNLLQAHCDAQGYCDAGPLGDAKTAGNVSTAAFVLGAALLTSGAVLVLFGPDEDPPSRSGARLAPTVTANGGGVTLGGAW